MATASANVVTVTAANFDTEVLKSSVPVMVDFWAEWCGPCKQIAPVVNEIADSLAGEVKVGKIDVQEEQDLAVKYRINGIPAFLFFKDGEVRDQVVGRVDKSVLVNKLKALV